MTTGEMIFYAGAALLALTAVLAVAFAVKSRCTAWRALRRTLES